MPIFLWLVTLAGGGVLGYAVGQAKQPPRRMPEFPPPPPPPPPARVIHSGWPILPPAPPPWWR